MTLNINSAGGFVVTLPHGYVRSKTSSSTSPAGQSSGLTDRVLYGAISQYSEASQELASNNALYTAYNKTRKLHQSLSSFQFPAGNLPGLFRTASVSDSNKATAQASSGATSARYLVGIDRLASAKTNRSKTLVSTETTELADGTYSFTLTVGDNSYSLSVEVTKNGLQTDNNKDVLEKLASEIRTADENIEASVTETERKAYSLLSDDVTEKVVYLTVRSKSTGDSDSFSFSDDTDDIINTLDVNRVSFGGLTSQYDVNGVANTGTTNTASVDNDKLTISFFETTANPTTVTVKEGLKPVEEKLIDLIALYNDYISWLNQNTRYIRSEVRNGIVKEIDSISRDLKSVGIQADTDGTVNLTEEFATSLRGNIGGVREALTGENGLFTKVSEKLTKILENGVQAYAESPGSSSTYSPESVAGIFSTNMQRSNLISLYA